MDQSINTECCPRFNPEPWDEKLITFENKLFIKDHVISMFHIPLNYGAVMARNDKKVKNTKASTDSRIILTDENSLWGADIYFEVSRELPDTNIVKIPGTFLSKVFEGNYSQIKRWIRDMDIFVRKNNKHMNKLYFYYTTCPKCAIKYGKNYVVLLAQISN